MPENILVVYTVFLEISAYLSSMMKSQNMTTASITVQEWTAAIKSTFISLL